MKRLLTIFILFLSINAPAQDWKVHFIKNYYQNYWYDSVKIFPSYYNRLQIVYDKVGCDKTILKSDNFEIHKDRNCFYYVRILDRNSSTWIKVFKGKTYIDSFRVFLDNDLPFDIRLRRKYEGYVFDYHDLDTLYCEPGFYDEYNQTKITFRVLSFVAEVVINEQPIYTEYTGKNKFSRTFINKAKAMKKGDRILLKSIVISDADNNIYTISEKRFEKNYN